MDGLERDLAAGRLEGHAPPCLSLYQQTHRHHPDNQQDPIRFRNLVKALEESLLQAYDKDVAEPLLAPFHALANDRAFWNHALDGLAVLGAKGFFRAYKLQRPVHELHIVADSFHTKPLLRIVQSADRYQVLGLRRHEIKLFEGNRDQLDEVDLAEGVPRTITEALGDELTEPHMTVASYGGVGRGQSAMHHGHGGKAEEVDADAERFFRAVDRAILEQHSQPSGLPLILASLPEHHALFRRVSRNGNLLEDAIDVHPDDLSLDELGERAWQVVEPAYRARLADLAEEFGSAMPNGLAADDVEQVAKAVVEGRVAKVLVEAERMVPGRVDAATGAIMSGDEVDPEVDDVLDDVASLASKLGAQVVVVPADQMPSETGIAAIFRY
ncbi:MAG: hypothetical protein R6W77_06990 [Trueperaceae bacterium]